MNVYLVFVIMVLALTKLMVIHAHVSLATMEQIVKSTLMNAVVSMLIRNSTFLLVCYENL